MMQNIKTALGVKMKTVVQKSKKNTLLIFSMMFVFKCFEKGFLHPAVCKILYIVSFNAFFIISIDFFSESVLK